jgi:hypothetical protein
LKSLVISPSDNLDPLLANEDLLSTAPSDDKTIIEMDEDLYGPKDEDILRSFPPPPIDHDTYAFLEDLANSVDATPVRITNTAKPRRHYVELTGKDWLNRMRQKTIPYSRFQLRKPVIDGEATALALQVEAILEQQQTSDKREALFWEWRTRKKFEGPYRKVWRDRYHKVVGEQFRRMRGTQGESPATPAAHGPHLNS